VLARFCPETKPFISDRVNASHSFEAFLSATEPSEVVSPPQITELRLGVSELVSTTTKITTPPLFRKRMREEQVDYHDVSGRLARMLGR
jgi:hypothetical protein